MIAGSSFKDASVSSPFKMEIDARKYPLRLPRAPHVIIVHGRKHLRKVVACRCNGILSVDALALDNILDGLVVAVVSIII